MLGSALPPDAEAEADFRCPEWSECVLLGVGGRERMDGASVPCGPVQMEATQAYENEEDAASARRN